MQGKPGAKGYPGSVGPAGFPGVRGQPGQPGHPGGCDISGCYEDRRGKSWLCQYKSYDFMAGLWLLLLGQAETSVHPSGTISPAKPPLQSSQGDPPATHMDKSQFHGLFITYPSWINTKLQQWSGRWGVIMEVQFFMSPAMFPWGMERGIIPQFLHLHLMEAQWDKDQGDE